MRRAKLINYQKLPYKGKGAGYGYADAVKALASTDV